MKEARADYFKAEIQKAESVKNNASRALDSACKNLERLRNEFCEECDHHYENGKSADDGSMFHGFCKICGECLG